MMRPDFENLKEEVKNIEYANALYAALCNVKWVNRKTKKEYSCTWRFAGGIVAELRNKGESYLDFYCGGNEGKIREDIYKDMRKLGWKPKAWPGDEVEIIPYEAQPKQDPT